MKPNILIIEDDAVLGGAILQRLTLEGFNAVLARNCAEALRHLRRGGYDFVLSDIVLPDGSGEDLFRQAQAFLGETPILFVTAFGQIDQAVRLVKAGADDYLTKPYDVDDLVQRIYVRVNARRIAAEPMRPADFDAQPSTRELAAMLRQAAQADLPVLLTGETGVGKEVAARYLHACSPRAASPFVAVNCGAIPHELLESQFFGHERGAFTGASQAHIGYFEETGEGTLFLDEIGELAPRLQAALLRVLQNREFRPVGARGEKCFGGRIVAATNADLVAMRAAGDFRDDLYFRLSVLEIPLLPLRKRRDEVEPLTRQFLFEFSAARPAPLDLSDDALATLLAYDWPGNVRELRNRLQRACVFAKGSTLESADIFPERKLEDREADGLANARQKAESDIIEQALIASQGRVGEAAKRLGISRTTLWKYRNRAKP